MFLVYSVLFVRARDQLRRYFVHATRYQMIPFHILQTRDRDKYRPTMSLT